MNEWINRVNDSSRKTKTMTEEEYNIKAKEYWNKLINPKCKPFIETNALIARFMGYEIDDSHAFFHGIHYYKMDADSDKTYDQLTIDNVRSHTTIGFVNNYTTTWERRYDTCWNHLMEVIDKIESKGFHTNIEYFGEHRVYFSHDSVGERDSNKITATYKAVIQFIEWYNKQQK